MEAFRGYVSDQVGKYVQLERGGPEACQGCLLHVGRDYVTLSGVDGSSLHLPLHHIRSVTPFPDAGLESSPPMAPGEERPETFGGLLARHVGQGVRLNHAGPETSVGTLVSFTDDHLVLEVEPGIRIGYARFHVRSVCLFTAYETEGASPSSQSYHPNAAIKD